MEPSIYKYILNHTLKDQLYLILITAISLPFVYVSLEIPKIIINEAISGKNLPETLLGFEISQISYLLVLCAVFLVLVSINGAFKYLINVYRGVVGERMLRRFRYDLYTRILRFPLPHFKHTSQGEIIPMVIAETEPLGGFIGESFAQPAFQGGILLTYLSFIFVQDVFLGIAAIMMYPLQMWLIPRLQKKVNALAKRRVQTVRKLSDRIGETVSGITEIHAHDTSHYFRAVTGDLMGRIYEIRYELFRRKFFIKFLNNFLDKITPFFFYSVGGYFVIKGELTLGALVATLAAYKDISTPWKALLKYYQTKEDVRVKYAQIIEQFQPDDMLDPALLDHEPETISPLSGNLTATNVSYDEGSAEKLVDGASFDFELGQHVIALGLGNSGKEELGMLLARLLRPSSGRILVDGANISELPESIMGRRTAYVGPTAYIFSGSIRNNLVYGLKHKPLSPPIYDETEQRQRQRELDAARITSTSLDDIRADWTDYAAAGVEDADGLEARYIQLLEQVDLTNDVYQLGLRSTADPAVYQMLVDKVLTARIEIRDRLQDKELVGLVDPFDKTRFNLNMSVAENLLFGTPLHPSFNLTELASNTEMHAVLTDCKLVTDLTKIGITVAETMLELFADAGPDSELMEQFSFISAEELPEFRNLLATIDRNDLNKMESEDRGRFLSLSFLLVPNRHRLGLIDEPMQDRLVTARTKLSERLRDSDAVEFFDPDRFSHALSVQDNILFGRLVFGQARAETMVGKLISEIVTSVDLRQDIIKLGLDYDVGVGGSRLPIAFRQKLAIARCLIKQPDILIANQATSALDANAELSVLTKLIDESRDRTLVWVTDRAELLEHFDKGFLLDAGKIHAQGTPLEIKQSETFQRLFPTT